MNQDVYPAEHVPVEEAESELNDEGEDYCHDTDVAVAAVLYHLNHDDGEHISHRVVAAAFKLEQGL